MPNSRKLLYPFAVLYNGVTGFRNRLYDTGFLESTVYDLPLICVGNLNVGGTGKSPMIEYLIALLKDDFKLATLSRGYKRNTKGFKLVEAEDTAIGVGDEPLQFKNKFKEVMVAVEADRRHGIAELLKFSPDVILLDDAYQHRKVKAGLNILLTAFNDLYVNDLLLPAGNLRESCKGSKRADIIVVTKCPENLSSGERKGILKKLKPEAHQVVFFSSIIYGSKLISKDSEIPLNDIPEGFTLLTGIANPKPLVDYLQKNGKKFKHFNYPDHHNFNDSDLKEIRKQKAILTTEKDYMRLKGKLGATPLYYLPIKLKFLENQDLFNRQITSFINEK